MRKYIQIKDFSEYPGLRHCSISDDSGEEFYHKILNKEFKDSYEKKEKIEVNLDYTAGYAPSFLDEAFGNLIYDFGIEAVKENLIIVSDQEPDLKEMIVNETFVQWQERRENEDKPKKTEKHKPWFRKVNNEIIQTVE
ncbi:STAS-like domain-containing protein [Robertkochia solimangrovi]|uniref:STAS-like domain-containing protein n=1 Tax=Robertkochia solimangrovi TaxID=2213046 RepID=UPI00117ED777|nr:STAS-like domain-containing protein [Robertkochia solimangrovi]TRZ45136.1 hypothetical protein DMZ48_05135 [Robertkochia solimangrovi]